MRANSSPARILLVDDHEGSRVTFAALLEEEGHRVLEAASLAEAQKQMASGPFELAILDVDLGDGRGLDLIGDLVRRFPKIGLVILTGDVAQLSTEQTGRVDAVLGKANEPADLMVEVNRVIRTRAAN